MVWFCVYACVCVCVCVRVCVVSMDPFSLSENKHFDSLYEAPSFSVLHVTFARTKGGTGLANAEDTTL